MYDPNATIRKFMTYAPHTIADEAMLSKAQESMRVNDVPHLPVLHDGKLVGILSERDIALAEALDGVDLRAVPVRVAMNTSVFQALPDTLLVDVLQGMAERKVGSCVVMLGSEAVGIFTTVDVCRWFAKSLKEPGERAA